MTWTSHGHHITGTMLSGHPSRVARCGGPAICPECSKEAAMYRAIAAGDKKAGIQLVETMLAKAQRIVFEHVREDLEKNDTPIEFNMDDVYIVWWSKVLENWKALLSTTLPDGMYYELTYNGAKHETYLDAYKKFQNVRLPD